MHIFDSHVQIERKPLPAVLSMDEHYFPQSSYDSLYICILMDFNTGTIIDVLPDRKKDYLAGYFTKIRMNTHNVETGLSELDNVKYVSIDLYNTYKRISKIYFPKAIICADSFHVIEHLTKDFRDIRIKCRKSTEDPDMKYLLTKFKYVFNHDTFLDNEPRYNKRFKKYLNHRDIISMMFNHFPELKTAYELKEMYINFNSSCSKENASENLAVLIDKFAASGIKEYIEFYNMLRNWFIEIVNPFSIYDGRRINNSFIESRNRQIDLLQTNAYGFTNFNRSRNRILYCLNRNDSFKL